MAYSKAWLNYQAVENIRFPFDTLYAETVDKRSQIAAKELQEAAKKLAKAKLNCISDPVEIKRAADETMLPATRMGIGAIFLETDKKLPDAEGYRIERKDRGLVVCGGGESGLLYGTFALIRIMQTNPQLLSKICSGKQTVEKIPANPLRMLNHWDNVDGSIERGYAGNSFFFVNNELVIDGRTRDYARLLASVGINGTVINNVNVRGAATELITQRYLPQLKELAELFLEYGVKLYLSLNFAAPIELGGLKTCDPLDGQVQDFWKRKMDEIYAAIPSLGGFLVKADSEGRPGPFTYGRNHAQGANMLAKVIRPHGGIIIWRCFVYNCKQDWRDRKTDRARAGYDNFMPLDGQFDENVILQIKNGPMDFQVREPVSPLFSGLRKTNMMLEVQAAQEYTGQQKHLCYLVPMWKEVLDFKTYSAGSSGEGADTVADIVSGRLYGQKNCGMAAVANTGDDENWTGHDMAAANFYGFARLAFDTGLTAEGIAREWICSTYGCNREIMDCMLPMLLSSWEIYEKYTSPLGIGWMVNPSHHYGPNVDGYEYDRWGTYHYSDCHGMGVDRTLKGTGYVAQYNEPNCSMFEDIKTCPEELLLFFHHVPYTYRLKTGKTLIQHIYDSHFEGAMQAQNMLLNFDSLKHTLPPGIFEHIHTRLKIQADHAKEWRDRINT
ncbi:MAG: alpha-glucuronidase, partial [Lachnospiraceae bacterium]|nr:alpha-glucuronidase [Lachnospiraceae bacterium]